MSKPTRYQGLTRAEWAERLGITMAALKLRISKVGIAAAIEQGPSRVPPLIVDGVRVADMPRAEGVTRDLVWVRVRRLGWSLHDALNTPALAPAMRRSRTPKAPAPSSDAQASTAATPKRKRQRLPVRERQAARKNLDEIDMAIIADRIDAPTPVPMTEIAARFGITRQAVWSREQRLRRLRKATA